MATRNDRDPREIKALFKRLWSRSDGARSFCAALQERGFALCRGDRRGYVAVDYLGNVYSLSRWLDVRTKDLAERCAALSRIPGVDEARNQFAEKSRTSLDTLTESITRERQAALAPLIAQRRKIVAQQRSERAGLAAAQERRRVDAARTRATQLRSGLKGLFDWVTGRRRSILRNHQQQIAHEEQADSLELAALRESQKVARCEVQTRILTTRSRFNQSLLAFERIKDGSKCPDRHWPEREEIDRSR